MNFPNLTLSEKHPIFPSPLNDSLAGYSSPGCRPPPLMTWNTSCQPRLASKVSLEKSADRQPHGKSPVGNCPLFSCCFQDSLLLFNLGSCNDDVPWCAPPWVQLLWDSLSFLDFLDVY